MGLNHLYFGAFIVIQNETSNFRTQSAKTQIRAYHFSMLNWGFAKNTNLALKKYDS